MAFRLCVYVAFFVYLNENYCYSRLLQGIPKDTYLTKTSDNKMSVYFNKVYQEIPNSITEKSDYKI